jgi:hypothetical protein
LFSSSPASLRICSIIWTSKKWKMPKHAASSRPIHFARKRTRWWQKSITMDVRRKSTAIHSDWFNFSCLMWRWNSKISCRMVRLHVPCA